MQIPVFKRAVNAPEVPSALKPLPLLAAVNITLSYHRSIFYRCSYFVFALCLLCAFYPFVFEQPVWLLAVVPTFFGLWLMYRKEISGEVTGALGFIDNQWVLEQAGTAYKLELAGEVLCWPWIVILPFRVAASGESRRILLFSDALSLEDGARLRAWLRASLNPKT